MVPNLHTMSPINMPMFKADMIPVFTSPPDSINTNEDPSLREFLGTLHHLTTYAQSYESTMSPWIQRDPVLALVLDMKSNRAVAGRVLECSHYLRW